jgi:YVTN family beta-propeller protein/VCBS repeat-containing protein
VSAIIDTPTAGQPTISLGSVTQSYTGNIGDVVTGNAGFTDAAGRALTYSAPATSTGGGTVTIDSSGNFTYTPTTTQRKAAGVNTRTTDTFTVTANNGVNTASQTITVPVDPTFTSLSVYARGPMVISPDGKYLYVPVTNAIAVINTATNTTAPSFTSLPNVTAMAVNPSGSDLYEALNGLAGSIANIPVSLGRPKTTFAALNGYVTSLAISPDGKTLYAADLSGTVSVISTTTFQTTRGATVPSGPTAIAVSPDGSRLYITSGGREGTVTVVNTATNAITSTIPVGDAPAAAAVSPDGSRLYVANTNSATVSVINTATNAVTSTITVGGFTLGALAISPDAKHLYALGGTGNNQSVTVINTAANAVTNTIVLDTGLQSGGSLAISPDGRQLYVSTGTAVNTIKIA